jgi:hypothetical protein
MSFKIDLIRNLPKSRKKKAPYRGPLIASKITIEVEADNYLSAVRIAKKQMGRGWHPVPVTLDGKHSPSIDTD